MIHACETYVVDCPFVRDVHTKYDKDGPSQALRWRPGVTWDEYGPRAHGMGKVKYRVVSVHQLPHPYPCRVFFTRQWLTPDGREFGRNKLIIMTAEAFRRRTKSYRPAGVDEADELIVRDMDEAERQKALGK